MDLTSRDYNNTNSDYNDGAKAKIAEPRHLELAREISSQMIDNFSPTEQREALDFIFKRIESNYNDKVSELQRDLQCINENRDTFLGNPSPVKAPGY